MLGRKFACSALALLLTVSLVPAGASAFADETASAVGAASSDASSVAPVPGADAPVSPTDASTRVGLEGYEPASDGAFGPFALESYSLGATGISHDSIIAFAKQYVGVPYVWGGKDIVRDGGFDCSGFVCWVFNHVCGTFIRSDYTNAESLYKKCTPITRAEARPGDVVFFQGTYGALDYISHVGIYCGDGVMIDAGSPIGYDRIDDVHNRNGQVAGQLFGRLVDLDASSVTLSSPGVELHMSNASLGAGGKPLSPIVSSYGTVLTEGTDYTVSYSGNSREGMGTATVRGIGKSSGMVRTTQFRVYQGSDLKGQYSLHPVQTRGMALDITAGSMENGAYAQLYETNGTPAQSFVLEPQASGQYAIKCAKSGLFLSAEVFASNVGSYARIQQKVWTGHQSQLWDIIPLGDGSYTITSGMDGRFALDVDNNWMRNGVRIQLYPYNGAPAQRWTFDNPAKTREQLDSLAAKHKNVLADGVYSVRSAVNGTFAFDCKDGGIENGTPIQAFGFNGSAAQSFRVEHDAQGYITLINTKSGRAVDVAGASLSAGTQVQLWDANGTYAQKWVAVPSGGHVRLVSALHDSIALDLAGASAHDGARLQIYDANGTPAQEWAFMKLS